MCRNTFIPFLNGRTPPFLKSLFKSTQRQCHAFSRVTTPSQSISPPCCSMLFHGSTMPCNSNACLIYAIPLRIYSRQFHCCSPHCFSFAVCCSKPFRAKRRVAVAKLRISLRFFAIPLLGESMQFRSIYWQVDALSKQCSSRPGLCASIHFGSRASRRSTSQFLCVAMLGSALPCSTLPLLCAA